ncbi:MAG: D-glycero-beta-D-manno-heptose-7-phosphate kinase [bacterium]
MKIKFSPARLKRVIQAMKRARILVLGDLMLDDFIRGKVSRISPEAPVPVVLVTQESAYPGGAANVGRNLADFGIHAEMCGVIGNDASGDRLMKLLRAEGIGASGILRLDDFTTIRKARIIARNQQVVRVDHESRCQLDAASLKKLESFLRKTIPQVDAVILEDYAKGFITQELVDMVVSLARKHGKIVTVDPNMNNPLCWAGVTAVKPNRSEAFAVLQRPASDDPKELLNVGKQLLQKWDTSCVMITIGEGGMMLFQRGQPPYHTPTRAQEVFDVSGAGDTAIAFFTAALAAGLNAWEAAEIANHAAGIVVGKLGTATLQAKELEASLERDSLRP